MQKKAFKLAGRQEIRLFFLLCWVTYFSTYVGRLNFTACLTEISAAEGFSRAQMGLIGSGFFFGYGICQLLSGFLGDRLNPRWMIFFGAVGSGLLNLAMGWMSNPNGMALIWMLNGIVQSTVWSPMIRLTAEWLKPEQCVKSCVNYATTTPIGTVAAYLLSAGAIVLYGWRASFWAAGALLLGTAFLWLAGTKKVQRILGERGELFEEEEPGALEEPACQKKQVKFREHSAADRRCCAVAWLPERQHPDMDAGLSE